MKVRRSSLGLFLLLLLVGGLGACGSKAADRAQPAPNVTTFEAGNFDGLPHPPRSEPLGERSDTGGVVTRSYRVAGTSPQQVLDFYVSELRGRGWVPGQAVESTGSATYRGTWTKQGNELSVSSTTAPTLGQGDSSSQAYSQYSLMLMLAR